VKQKKAGVNLLLQGGKGGKVLFSYRKKGEGKGRQDVSLARGARFRLFTTSKVWQVLSDSKRLGGLKHLLLWGQKKKKKKERGKIRRQPG